MTYWSKKWPAVMMGLIAMGVGIFAGTYCFAMKNSHYGFLIIGAWFVFGGIFFFWSAFQRRCPELRIEEDAIWVRGSKFERRHIFHARVAPITFNGGHGHHLILQFHQMPDLSRGWKMLRVMQRWQLASSMAPKCDNFGQKLPEEPRLIIGLGWMHAKDLQRVSEQLKQSEQTEVNLKS
jgi:hypothetical protein